jgi:hypothetical protein
MKLVLDTSVLIAGIDPPAGSEASISVVSIAELHHGALVAQAAGVRRERIARLGRIEAGFPSPLPIDGEVARIWGQFNAAVSERGGQPRSRSADLAIAATAVAHGAVLLTLNAKDLNLIKDLVAVRAPA